MRLFHRQLQHARQVRLSEDVSSSIKSNLYQPPALIPRSSSFSSRRFSLFPSLLSSQPSKNPTPAPKSSHPLSNPGPKHVDFGQETSPSQALGISLAAEVRKRAPAMTETYVAYGACDALVKECARQADYSIPQALEKRGVIPKTKDGEDLGVGSGPWYEGKLYSTFLSPPPPLLHSLHFCPPPAVASRASPPVDSALTNFSKLSTGPHSDL